GFPARIGVDGGFGTGVALQDERGLVAHLRHRRKRRKIPDDRRDQVAARPQVRREIYAIETPVIEVAARRPFGDALAVDEKLITLIGADVNDETRRRGGKRKRFAKVKDADLTP